VSDERTARLIRQCKKIAALFDELLPDTAIDSHGHRAGGVNPLYRRTASGLYLEFYYGYPSKIWTPGGRWSMTGSTITRPYVNKEDLVAPFMARLTTRLYESERHDRWRSYGPVYAILAIDGDPVEEPGPVDHLDYSAVKEQWDDLSLPRG
jgi:hypothetical protein